MSEDAIAAKLDALAGKVEAMTAEMRDIRRTMATYERGVVLLIEGMDSLSHTLQRIAADDDALEK